MDSRKFLYDNNELFQSISLPSQDLPAPALYVVGLPIGNLGDITLRALLVLSKADCIAAEDTRETRKLLEKFNIESHLFPVHQHNEHKGAEKVLTYLAEGKRVALVTDACGFRPRNKSRRPSQRTRLSRHSDPRRQRFSNRSLCGGNGAGGLYIPRLFKRRKKGARR